MVKRITCGILFLAGALFLLVRYGIMYPPVATVTISGEVIFVGYEKGPIVVSAQSRKGTTGLLYTAFTEIPNPGRYTLQVPTHAGELYVGATNFDPRPTGPKGAADAPKGEYEENLLKVGSENIDGVNIVLHSSLKPPTGPAVTISGEITFEDYKEGPITIAVRSKKGLGPPDIALVEIPEPGRYSLKIPANVGEIYVIAVNFEDEEKDYGIPANPFGGYRGNPLKVGSEDIKGIDIVMRSLLKPPTGPTVTISGEIAFEDYKTGPIIIAGQSKKGPDSPDIALVDIPGPGRYTLRVPVNVGDIYIMAGNFDPATAGPEEAAEAPKGRYGENPLKVGSENIDGVNIVLHSSLKPPTGPTVTISGEITFEDYKEGPITIAVRSKKGPGPPDIALVKIPEPGRYSLKIPANVGEIYVIAVNFEDEEKGYGIPANPFGGYRGNPLKVGSEDIKGIDIVMRSLLKPPTGPTVAISGEITFEDYKKGPISVVAQSKRAPAPPDIALVNIPGPGRYTLRVPANAGDIYVMAVNIDLKTAGPKEVDAVPGGAYQGNPLKVFSKDIGGVNIVLSKR